MVSQGDRLGLLGTVLSWSLLGETDFTIVVCVFCFGGVIGGKNLYLVSNQFTDQ